MSANTSIHHKPSPEQRDNSKKRHRNDREGSTKRHRHKEHRDSQNRDQHHGRIEYSIGASNELTIMDDDGDEAEWVEKDKSEDGAKVLATDIPTGETFELALHATEPTTAKLPPSLPTASPLKRDEWMLLEEAPSHFLSGTAPVSSRFPGNESLTEDYGEATTDLRTTTGAVDFFSTLGIEHKKKQPDRPDPDKPIISSKELNVQLKEGKILEEYDTPVKPKVAPGSAGHQWRMKKLQRTYETAQEEGRPVEVVALERYGSQEDFEEAKEEKRFLDEREQRRDTKGNSSSGDPRRLRRDDTNVSSGETKYIFAELSGSESRPPSRASFRRPGVGTDSPPSTPRARLSTPSTPAPPPNMRVDLLRRQSSLSRSGAASPVPSVLPPTPTTIPSTKRALSPSSLNKLQARVLKAKLMNASNATQLEKEFEAERERAASVGSGGIINTEGTKIEMVPTLDGRGRVFDVGTGKEDGKPLPGNRRKKEMEMIETRDPKTGALVRYNADDDSTTLGEMLRQERFSAGMSDQKNMDAEYARAIATDGHFENDLDYMDDNADRLGRKKMRTDAMKRQFAIHDYAKTRKVLATCPFCYGEDDSPPKAPVIAMGTKAYLSCTLYEELVDGHCLIVPIQHHLTMLEADDDVWDEVKNFMKCLIRMAADNESGYIFYETVINLKWQKHTVIDCVPVPMEHFDDLPAYFRESILASEAEWSQHKKLIDFSERPGGFRRAMVPNLPYFMVQWDYKGEKGYGHVIEGVGDAAGVGDPDGAVDEGEKGGGEFPRHFAAEIIGNVLDLEPRRWRRPRRMDRATNHGRTSSFRAHYGKYDWTGMIGR